MYSFKGIAFVVSRLVILFFLIAGSFSRADTIVIGTQNLHYYPHYDFTSENDKGLAWAIFEAFKATTKHEFVYISMPVLRLQKELAKGSVDFIYPDNPKWYNPIISNTLKTFSQPVTRALGGTILRPGKVGAGIDEIRRLAMPLGFTPVNWQERVDNQLTHLIRVNDTLNALELIAQNKADAANLEYHVTQHIASQQPSLGKFTLDPELPHDGVAFMLATISHTDLLAEFNAFLVSHQPLIKRLHKQYRIKSPDVILNNLSDQYY
ncbi:amino acid ABC transporter substrate-binding protein [Alteromonas sp. ZYF713]|nr:amino acid ABC transporter substrate-binding protein [Alteromonas sp. ZYF713]